MTHSVLVIHPDSKLARWVFDRPLFADYSRDHLIESDFASTLLLAENGQKRTLVPIKNAKLKLELNLNSQRSSHLRPTIFGARTMNAKWEGILPIIGTVLIVEDDQTLCTLMGYILADMGAEPIAYTTADEALAYLLQNHAHCPLMIVDQGLPGKIRGIEFLEMVRDKWPLVRSILTSGYLLEPATIPYHTVYLDKPWSPDQLIAAVVTILQLTAPSTALDQSG